jgi:integrase
LQGTRRCDQASLAVGRAAPGCGAGLRIHEALALGEADLDQRRGSLLVRRGEGGRRREVGVDD